LYNDCVDAILATYKVRFEAASGKSGILFGPGRGPGQQFMLIVAIYVLLRIAAMPSLPRSGAFGTARALHTGVSTFWLTRDAGHATLTRRSQGSCKLQPMRSRCLVVQAKGGSLKAFKMLRVYALVNAAMADATIAAWHEKYKHMFWCAHYG
jgi:hypothetical protein